MSMPAESRIRVKQDIDPDVTVAVRKRLDRGQMLGMGRSCTLGWFTIEGLNREGKRADTARFEVSCGSDERNYVFGQTLRYTQCKAAENSGDDIHTIVEIVPCLTS